MKLNIENQNHNLNDNDSKQTITSNNNNGNNIDSETKVGMKNAKYGNKHIESNDADYNEIMTTAFTTTILQKV